MPGGDGTGPLGHGRRTGRGAGFCGGFRMPGFMNPLVYGGRSPRAGRGRMFFRGSRPYFYGRGPMRAARRPFGPWWDYDIWR